jgi:hypothetical protein
MSALGQKRTLHGEKSMSALPPKAGIRANDQDVCLVPKSEIKQTASLIPRVNGLPNSLVGSRHEQHRW